MVKGEAGTRRVTEHGIWLKQGAQMSAFTCLAKGISDHTSQFKAISTSLDQDTSSTGHITVSSGGNPFE
jgi:hypothetical protein